MKKAFALILTAILASCMLTGCGSSESSSSLFKSGNTTNSTASTGIPEGPSPAALSTVKKPQMNVNELIAGQKVENTGSCGENATFTLYENGVAVIEGTGTISRTTLNDAKTVIVGEGITEITRRFFFAFKTLEEVQLPSTLQKIGDQAFKECYSLRSIWVPDGVNEIGEYAFNVCHSLTEVRLPDTVTTMGEHVFRGCDKIETANLPSMLTTVPEGTFYDSKKLKSINIPSGVTEIGNGAFYGCESLTEIVIPAGVTTIDKYAFSYNYGITSVTIPASVETLGKGVFSGWKDTQTIIVEGKTERPSTWDPEWAGEYAKVVWKG